MRSDVRNFVIVQLRSDVRKFRHSSAARLKETPSREDAYKTALTRKQIVRCGIIEGNSERAPEDTLQQLGGVSVAFSCDSIFSHDVSLRIS